MTIRFVFAASVCALLAGCQSARAPTPAATSPAVASDPAPRYVFPSGSACGERITQFRAVIVSDRDTGNAGKGVADRALAEIDAASAACAAGRDGEALRMIAATKAKFGYP